MKACFGIEFDWICKPGHIVCIQRESDSVRMDEPLRRYVSKLQMANQQRTFSESTL